MDRPDIPFDDIRQNMKELDFINAKLGGHKITLDGVRSIVTTCEKQIAANGGIISVLEIGCGGGDNLRVLKNYFKKKNLNARLSGLDINPHCIEFARSRPENAGIHFITSDYKLVAPAQKPDIIFCSLFCHHFTNEELLEIFQWMKHNSAIGFFMNDLHRHPIAYYSINWLAKLFSKNYLVKNDAPLSVLRGFKRKELEQLLKKGSILKFRLSWKWAFRWLLVYTHE